MQIVATRIAVDIQQLTGHIEPLREARGHRSRVDLLHVHPTGRYNRFAQGARGLDGQTKRFEPAQEALPLVRLNGTCRALALNTGPLETRPDELPRQQAAQHTAHRLGPARCKIPEQASFQFLFAQRWLQIERKVNALSGAKGINDPATGRENHGAANTVFSKGQLTKVLIDTRRVHQHLHTHIA